MKFVIIFITLFNSNLCQYYTNIVEGAGANYKEFIYNADYMNWDDAKAYCQNLGGSLVVIKSAAEETNLNAFPGSYDDHRLWMGATDWKLDGFTWVDGSTLTYSNWEPGEPSGGGLHCIARENKKWNNLSCGDEYPSACQKIHSCPAGSYCPDGYSKTVCPAGFYCPAGSSSKTTCSPGTYCPQESGSSTTCPAGSYCPDGISKNTCPAGSYCPNSGMSSPTVCPAGTYCPAGSSSKTTCSPGTYCPQESGFPVTCPAGSYCPNSEMSSPTTCDPGYYCPNSGMTSQLSCNAGYYCPVGQMSTKTKCPYGNYCPIGSIDPTLTTNAMSGEQDIYATTSKVCSNDICYRYLLSRNTVQEDSFDDALLLNDNSNTIKVVNLVLGTKINLQSGMSISGGKQIYVECEQDTFHTPIFLENLLVLSETDGNIFNKIVFKNCLVIGSIELQSGTSIILDNSSLSGPLTISSSSTNPSYIVMMDNSQIVGTNIPAVINERSNNIIIIKEGGDSSVYGCDMTPTCDQSTFFNNDEDPQNEYENYYSNLETMWFDANQDKIPSGAIAGTVTQKIMSIQSFLTCGAFGNSVHPRSTYFGYALYCGMNSDAIFDHYKFFSRVSDYINNIYVSTNDGDYETFNYIKQVSLSRSYLYETADFNQSSIVMVPRVTAEFLRVKSCTFCIPYLQIHLEKIRDDIKAAYDSTHLVILTLRNAIDSAAIGQDISSQIDDNQKDLINNQVILMKRIKDNSQVSYDNTKYALDQANDQSRLATAKFSTIDNEVTQHQKTIDDMKDNMIKDWKREVENEKIKNGFDLAISFVKGMGSAAALGMGDPSAAGDFADSIKGVFDSTQALVDNAEVSRSSPAFKTLDASFKDYKDATNKGIKATKDYANGDTIDMSAFSMPISEIDIMRDSLISYLKSDSGCDGTYPKLSKNCNKMNDEISAIALLLKEKNNGIMKSFEAQMNIKLLQYEKDQYEKNIQNWDDGIQSVSNSADGDCQYANQIQGIANTKQQQLDYALKTTHSGLAKTLTHSVLMVNNAITAIRTICRAIVYQNPGFLNGENPTWSEYCDNTLAFTSLDSTIDTLNGLLALMEHYWVNSEPPKSTTMSKMDITSLLPNDFIDNHDEGFLLSISPELYYLHSKDASLGDKENIDLIFINVYVTDSDGKLYKPKDSDDIYNNKVILKAPFLKQYQGNDYLFDIEGPKTSIYETQIDSTSSIGTLWSAADTSIVSDDCFAYETPFATMEIQIDPDLEIKDKKSKIFLQFHALGHGIRPTKRPTKKPTPRPSQPTLKPTKRPIFPTSPTQTPTKIKTNCGDYIKPKTCIKNSCQFVNGVCIAK